MQADAMPQDPNAEADDSDDDIIIDHVVINNVSYIETVKSEMKEEEEVEVIDVADKVIDIDDGESNKN